MRNFKDYEEGYRSGFDPILVLMAIIGALLVLEASWGQIYDYFGFKESATENIKEAPKG